MVVFIPCTALTKAIPPSPPPPTHTLQVLHINRQWDIEYRDLQHKFELYQQDAQQAQHENHSFIEQLKEQKEQMMEDVRALEARRTGGGGGREEELLKEVESLREELSKMKENKEKLERKLNGELSHSHVELT